MADGGDYPSLLPRPAEKLSMSEPVRPEPVAEPDPALDREIAGFEARLTEAVRDFNAVAPEVEASVAVAQGVAVGSDAWLTAQTQLARLDAARGSANSLLADIDRIAIDRGTAGKPEYPTLRTIRERAAAEANRQAGIITQLDVALRGA